MKGHYKKLIETLEKYRSLNLEDAIDYEKFNLYSLVHHTTSIEGSTLTEGETVALLHDNLSAHGKPFEDHSMVKDCYQALLFVLRSVKERRSISPDFLIEINRLVNRQNGGPINTALGTFDTSKGEYRLNMAYAQGGGFYLQPSKIEHRVKELCLYLNEALGKVNSIEDQYRLSFQAHYELVTIHPWADGNGRTSRLLMNYIQALFNFPLTKVYAEDRSEYIQALKMTREKEDIEVFFQFMSNQTVKFFEEKISEYGRSTKQTGSIGFNLF